MTGLGSSVLHGRARSNPLLVISWRDFQKTLMVAKLGQSARAVYPFLD